MRIFIGIKLDTASTEHVEKFLKPFKKIASPIRWVIPENIHITLKFIGDVPDKKYPQIEQALTEAASTLKTDALDLTLTGCGKFGQRDSLNIFWVGVAPNESLTQLYMKIEDALTCFDIPKEDRPFKPHITVGWNKRDFNFKSLFKLIEQYEAQRIVEMRVTHFQIYKSRLAPEGPVYSVLKEIPLVDA